MERIAGIEPTSPTWKEGVMTIIRYSHGEGQVIYTFKGLPQTLERETGLEPATLTLARLCSTN